MGTLDDEIGRSIQRSLDTGELAQAKSWQRPFAEDVAFDATPEEFRLAFKILKDSGYVPQEVGMMREISDLKWRLERAELSGDERAALEATVAGLEIKVRLRLEAMRRTGDI